ncbi:MAG: LysE family translocator [Salinivirgaceae bacterium]|nr:MAG: LysE family translocator [Salinivirgaceae bacterium]
MTESILYFISVGSLLGLSAGFSPGPLLALVLTQTIKYNRTEGIKVAISPLITDLPIILVTFFVFSEIAEFDLVLAIISFIGAAFVAYLGIESMRTKAIHVSPFIGFNSESLKKGVITNFLSPHPYLFWASVGMPLVFKAHGVNIITAILFFTAFYVFLIGSKILIAIIVSRTKVFINQKIYVNVMRVLGLALIIFAILFFLDGLNYFISK